jgi:hypothetical protein
MVYMILLLRTRRRYACQLIKRKEKCLHDRTTPRMANSPSKHPHAYIHKPDERHITRNTKLTYASQNPTSTLYALVPTCMDVHRHHRNYGRFGVKHAGISLQPDRAKSKTNKLIHEAYQQDWELGREFLFVFQENWCTMQQQNYNPKNNVECIKWYEQKILIQVALSVINYIISLSKFVRLNYFRSVVNFKYVMQYIEPINFHM